MNKRKLAVNFIPFIVIIIIIKFISFSYDRVEWYHEHIYSLLSEGIRFFTGIVPFSLGDLLYATVILLFLCSLIKLGRLLVQKKFTRQLFYLKLVSIVKWIMGIYILFSVCWGLNYQRAGIANQLKLNEEKYTDVELFDITDSLIYKVNNSRKKLPDSVGQFYTYQQDFEIAFQSYEKLKNEYPFLEYKSKSIKKSFFGKFGNYAGFLGYINPFTGEAQVNVTPPKFVLPFVSCHEIAHQIGYASESEANFVGYLAAKASQDSFFHYSVYFDLFLYANKACFQKDSTRAKENFKRLDLLVKNDFRKYKQFYSKYKNPFEPYIRKFYDQYLKANDQLKGVESYDEVIGLLIAFQKKNKSI